MEQSCRPPGHGRRPRSECCRFCTDRSGRPVQFPLRRVTQDKPEDQFSTLIIFPGSLNSDGFSAL